MYGSTKGRKASSCVYAVSLMVIITFALGMVFFNFVTSKVDFAKNTFVSQMSAILLQSFRMNATHVTACLQNAGNAFIKITGAYVNGLAAALTDAVQIDPGSVGVASVVGIFTEGCTYTVKLLSVFDTVLSFNVRY